MDHFQCSNLARLLLTFTLLEMLTQIHLQGTNKILWPVSWEGLDKTFLDPLWLYPGREGGKSLSKDALLG